MATPSDKLAQSLEALKSLQDQGIKAIRTKNMTRTHRDRLLKNGFIKEVMKDGISHLDLTHQQVKVPLGTLHSGDFVLIT